MYNPFLVSLHKSRMSEIAKNKKTPKFLHGSEVAVVASDLAGLRCVAIGCLLCVVCCVFEPACWVLASSRARRLIVGMRAC